MTRVYESSWLLSMIGGKPMQPGTPHRICAKEGGADAFSDRKGFMLPWKRRE